MSITCQSTSCSVGEGISISVSKPSPISAGDILVCFLYLNGGRNESVSYPSGFTEIVQINRTTNDGFAAMYWKRVTISESSAYNFEWSNSANSTAIILCFNNCEKNIDILESSEKAEGSVDGKSGLSTPELYTTSADNLYIVGAGVEMVGDTRPTNVTISDENGNIFFTETSLCGGNIRPLCVVGYELASYSSVIPNMISDDNSATGVILAAVIKEIQNFTYTPIPLINISSC